LFYFHKLDLIKPQTAPSLRGELYSAPDTISSFPHTNECVSIRCLSEP